MSMLEKAPANGIKISSSSSVLAVVPHYRCEPWLAQAVESLVQQTRPLDGIVVIDDGSPDPPLDIIERFPEVTLLRSPENVGPYALVQTVFQNSAYDAYLFQDADDWSSADRLGCLLRAAGRSGAELIGSYEVRLQEGGQHSFKVRYPKDANVILAKKPAHRVQLHPTTLVSSDLVDRLGGFATGLRFGADSEFLYRAHYVGRVVNVPRYCYFRRDRPDSLTGSPETGFKSPRRLELIEYLQDRAHSNAARVASGELPDLLPCAVAPPIQLEHLTGPRLRTRVNFGEPSSRSSIAFPR